jgi:hypothetical protein
MAAFIRLAASHIIARPAGLLQRGHICGSPAQAEQQLLP